ncbi:uncharacterized protein LOC109846086 [Asparagus officinalis]|uniref:uncharacterized protein LOC109846086 n=1 Tax=Asparagus officinalis TaxID=4686 RepID=UPI00098E3C3E|nr:uncharacterized protein LOC109846086 [Asparagus officinalis]
MESIASTTWKTGPRFYTGVIFEELSKVEGLNEDAKLVAYDYLTEDAARGRNFIGLPIHRRKRWLEIKLEWASYNLGISTRRLMKNKSPRSYFSTKAQGVNEE